MKRNTPSRHVTSRPARRAKRLLREAEIIAEMRPICLSGSGEPTDPHILRQLRTPAGQLVQSYRATGRLCAQPFAEATKRSISLHEASRETVVVTGGEGCVGSHLVHTALAERGSSQTEKTLRKEKLIQAPVPASDGIHEYTFEKKKFFIIKKAEDIKVLEARCPHQAAEIDQTQESFRCPVHGWTFHTETGNGLNNRSEMYPVHFEKRNGSVFFKVAVSEKVVSQKELPEDMAIKLWAHASLQFFFGNRSLLTDPWLRGNAFLNAWMPYPRIDISLSQIKPTYLCITHEHSDHLHEETLKELSHIPVFVPDFPNERIPKLLTRLGFRNIIPLFFGRRYEITPELSLCFYEPESLWNDAILLMEYRDCKILNINDAGLNHRIANQIGPIKILCSSFSNGASGYPLTWNHLSDERKIEIQENAKLGQLKMISDAVKLYNADTFLPFASHFSLWHPSHEKYIELFRKNNLSDVVSLLKNQNTGLIDLLPGDQWTAKENKIERGPLKIEEVYRKDSLQRAIQAERKKTHDVEKVKISESELDEYFLSLNSLTEMKLCEDLSIRVRISDQSDCERLYQITNRHLSICKQNMRENLTIEIPSFAMKEIMKGMSWDEAHIGYWCQLSRDPDVYMPYFWRLLQCPYWKKNSAHSAGQTPEISRSTKLVDLIEKSGTEAQRILSRFGLYCASCSQLGYETLEEGVRFHGLDPQKIEALLTTLNNVCKF